MGASLLTSVCLFNVWYRATCPQALAHVFVVVDDDWNGDESEEQRGLFNMMDRGELREGLEGQVEEVFWQTLLLFLKKKEKWLNWSSRSVLAFC